MKTQAILFDTIGTVVHEKKPNTVRDCFKLAFENHGVTPNDEVIRANRGKDKMVMINIILQQGHHSPSLALPIFKSFQKNLDANLDNFVAADQVVELFQRLQQMGIKIGLGSGLPREQFDKILEHLKWQGDDFEYVGISSELGKARPNPIMILNMMESLNITDKNTFIKVGDTVADIAEGKNAGVRTVGILSGTQSEAALDEAKADFLIHEIIEIEHIINRL